MLPEPFYHDREEELNPNRADQRRSKRRPCGLRASGIATRMRSFPPPNPEPSFTAEKLSRPRAETARAQAADADDLPARAASVRSPTLPSRRRRMAGWTATLGR